MAKQAQEAMGTEDLTALADRDYFKGEEILACDQAGIVALVPKPLTSNNRAEGLFDKQDFIYMADQDEYRCHAGQSLIKRFTSIEQGKLQHTYWSSACKHCALKPSAHIALSGVLSARNTKKYWMPCNYA